MRTTSSKENNTPASLFIDDSGKGNVIEKDAYCEDRMHRYVIFKIHEPYEDKEQRLSISEILERQRNSHGEELYLQQQGCFYHAYNEAAEILHSVTGYEIRTVRFRGEKIQKLGVPAIAILCVLQKFEKEYPQYLVEEKGKHFCFLMRY